MATTCIYFIILVGVLKVASLVSTKTCKQEEFYTAKNEFYTATNRCLKGHKIWEKTSFSVIHCGRDCLLDAKCSSFNYHRQSNLCELNNATQTQFPDHYLDKQGCFYADVFDGTQLTSVKDRPTTCQDLLLLGYKDSGIYTINPTGSNELLQVYCDMETAGGGWLVFQRRQNGSEDFFRTWGEYQIGFGNLAREFWLGNDNLRLLTESLSLKWELQVDLMDWEMNEVWAKYGEFSVSGELYTLHVGLYDVTSTVGDSLSYSSGYPFSTWDRDNEESDSENCAQKYEGAWWMNHCFQSDLNGRYYHTPINPSTAKGLVWGSWKGNEYTLKACNMKIREKIN